MLTLTFTLHCFYIFVLYQFSHDFVFNYYYYYDDHNIIFNSCGPAEFAHAQKVGSAGSLKLIEMSFVRIGLRRWGSGVGVYRQAIALRSRALTPSGELQPLFK